LTSVVYEVFLQLKINSLIKGKFFGGSGLGFWVLVANLFNWTFGVSAKFLKNKIYCLSGAKPEFFELKFEFLNNEKQHQTPG
jgi:hypothetical protein